MLWLKRVQKYGNFCIMRYSDVNHNSFMYVFNSFSFHTLPLKSNNPFSIPEKKILIIKRKAFILFYALTLLFIMNVGRFSEIIKWFSSAYMHCRKWLDKGNFFKSASKFAFKLRLKFMFSVSFSIWRIMNCSSFLLNC